ncbi:MAG: hypothetical protein J6S79_03355 [Lachnospiraceae bacterium]|nr:hypothetical protein [Lachnospiraceae bacterium]
MQKHFYSLLMAVFLVIALTLPGKAVKAADSEAQPYGLRADAVNGEIVVLYETPDEYGWYYIPAGTTVSFYGMPETGYYQAESSLWMVAEGEIELPNPVITYRDADNNFQYIVPTYDETTGWYSFTMPEAETFINISFYPLQDIPVDPEEVKYGLRTDVFNGEAVVLYETPDEYGWYYIPAGTTVSFYGMPETGYYQAESSLWMVAEGEIELPNPVITYRDADNNFQYIVPTYDETTAWYSFTMPEAETFINISFYPLQDIPVEPVESLYNVSGYSSNGELTIVELIPDENGQYYVTEGTEVSFYANPSEGYYQADHINFLVNEDILELPNPLVSYTDDDGVFHYIVPSYDETTGWYTFTMPASYVFINYDFQEIQEPDPAYFIGRVVAEGGSIEFVPENPESSACEGDIVTVEVTADQGYNLDEVVIFNAATLEDGSIEYIEDSYVDFWKNEDGTYSFVMPANPVQIFANFSKPSNPNSGSNGHGNGWGNGFGWGFGHNYGWGYGCGHGIGYGYGHNNYGYGNYGYGYGGYGFGYGYGNSCHSLLGGLVGLLNSCGLFR